ncbi:glycosyltransferase [Mycolicibacterium goodii]|uniref:4,4'-diaponeurosporenoate glycosyltransferase n=1 Tax=Mycolicibacterium goodii TaxID=134601 RepID=A0ABS6HPY0_MYCGD|nr:glycosyltransferase [Mycolicibacterium goodii]MBU8833115.1 glycosyltransferase [Mycolicibacterium goodii]MBU8835921.1 glycosyltransferase [Mycolicibacterium goodii]
MRARHLGAVIIPAYNEAAVIERTLAPLSGLAVDGHIELVVVCNGCRDNTADIARSVPGVRVLELEQGSKPAALNAGDHAVTSWPRLYLDADIQVTAQAVLAVFDRLDRGDVLVARPAATYDTRGAGTLVRSYYRARNRVPQHKRAMWGAGAYGLSEEGHRRFGEFPMITGDDWFIDAQFGSDEKAVVTTEPSVVTTPANIESLLAIRRRIHRGTGKLPPGYAPDLTTGSTGMTTAFAVMRTVRGPRSLFDAVVYVGVALAARWSPRSTPLWERDESSRSHA